MKIFLSTLLVYLVILFTACSPMKKEPEENIDHIILGINDLDKGIAQFKELTGVEPVYGGVHPYSFTHNALLALDHETYLEIMAPRPDAENIPDHFVALENLTPIDWAVRTRNEVNTKEKLKATGLIPTESKDGSRAKQDGSLLTWITFGIEQQNHFPFFIQWGAGIIHPSVNSPAGCTLQSFNIVTPDDDAMNKLNTTLKLGLTVSKGNQHQLQLILDTPKGKVKF